MVGDRIADAKTLQKKMIDKNINTISELAVVSGLNRNTLSKVLNGQIQPSADVMIKLVRTLDIKLTDAWEIFFSTGLHSE